MAAHRRRMQLRRILLTVSLLLAALAGGLTPAHPGRASADDAPPPFTPIDNVPVGGDLVHQDRAAERYTQGDNGTTRLRLYNDPIGLAGPSGWHPRDTTLALASTGVITPADLPFGLQIAPTLGPALATLTNEDGVALGLGLASIDGAAPAAVTGIITGSAVTYPAPVAAAPSDLALVATDSGLDVQVTLHNAGEAGPVVLALAPDARAHLDQEPGGTLQVMRPITDYSAHDPTTPYVTEQPEYVLEAPSALDSSAPSTATVHAGAVSMALGQDAAGGPTLTLGVDPAWLDDPARVFPVRLDLPIVTAVAAARTGTLATLNSCAPGTAYPRTGLVVGADGACTYRGLVRFDAANIPQNAPIVSATLRLYTPYQAGPTGVLLYPNAPPSPDQAQQAPLGQQPTGAGAPVVMTGAVGLAQSASDGQVQSWDVTSLVQQWAQQGEGANASFTLAGTGAPVYFADPRAALAPCASPACPAFAPPPCLNSPDPSPQNCLPPIICGGPLCPPAGTPTVPTVPTVPATPPASTPTNPSGTPLCAQSPSSPSPECVPSPCNQGEVATPGSVAADCTAAVLDVAYGQVGASAVGDNAMSIYGVSGAFGSKLDHYSFTTCGPVACSGVQLGQGGSLNPENALWVQEVRYGQGSTPPGVGGHFIRFGVTLMCGTRQPPYTWWSSADDNPYMGTLDTGGNPVDGDRFNVGNAFEILAEAYSLGLIPIINFNATGTMANGQDGCPVIDPGTFASEVQSFLDNMSSYDKKNPGVLQIPYPLPPTYFEIGNEENESQYSLYGSYANYESIFAAAASQLNANSASGGRLSGYFRVLTGGMQNPTANESCPNPQPQGQQTDTTPNIFEAGQAILAAESAGVPPTKLGVAVHPYSYTSNDNTFYWYNYREHYDYTKSGQIPDNGMCMDIDMMNALWMDAPLNGVPVIYTEINDTHHPDLADWTGSYLTDLFTYLHDINGGTYGDAATSPLRVAWWRGLDQDKKYFGLYDYQGNPKVVNDPKTPNTAGVYCPRLTQQGGGKAFILYDNEPDIYYKLRYDACY